MPNPREARRYPALLLAVAASVSALLVTTLSMPALASTQPSGRVAATHTKTAAKHHSAEFRARHALARAQKALAPSTPAAERPDATLALRNLWLLKDSLSPADQATAEKLAQRPSKPATVGNDNILIHYDPAELGTGYTIIDALASLSLIHI